MGTNLFDNSGAVASYIRALDGLPQLSQAFMSDENIERVCWHVEDIIRDNVKGMEGYSNMDRKVAKDVMIKIISQYGQRYMDRVNKNAVYSKQAESLGKHYVPEKALQKSYEMVRTKDRSEDIASVDELTAMAIKKLAERTMDRIKELNMYNKFLYNLDDQKAYSTIVHKKKNAPIVITNYAMDRIIP
jgi:hypothetical protein